MIKQTHPGKRVALVLGRADDLPALQTIQHQLELHSTGLMADFLQLDTSSGLYVPVTGKVLERSHDKYYCWNSCRSPWRLAVYYACALFPRRPSDADLTTASLEHAALLQQH